MIVSQGINHHLSLITGNTSLKCVRIWLWYGPCGGFGGSVVVVVMSRL